MNRSSNGNPRRCERRFRRRVAVLLAGHDRYVGLEKTVTANISSRGARVISHRQWDNHQYLVIASIPVRYISLARVAYCLPLAGDQYAVGLHFLEPAGKKVVGFSH